MKTSTFSITLKQQLLLGALLIIAMILTRGNITAHLQDASWAIFFLVGFYLRNTSISRYAFPVFFLIAFVIDLVVIDAQGGTHYCFTPSYPFLIPAYASLWFAGRWFAGHYQDNFSSLVKFVSAVVLGAFACFLISNAGFYVFSGKFEVMSLAEYAGKVSKYLPGYLSTTSIYLGFSALVHLSILHGSKLVSQEASS